MAKKKLGVFGKLGKVLKGSSDDGNQIADKPEKSAGDNVFMSPLKGEVLELSEVPDQVFSQKMMGDGFAIKPASGEVVAPMNGEIATFFPTKHAIGIKGNNGKEVLIHFGVDTVQLDGEGFKAMVKQGDKVVAGQTLLKVDIDKIEGKVSSIITPVIFTNLNENEKVVFKAGENVELRQEDIVTIK